MISASIQVPYINGSGFSSSGLWGQDFRVYSSGPGLRSLTLRLKMAQKPNIIIWSLGPKALKYESLEP